jgi:hypothetical protein
MGAAGALDGEWTAPTGKPCGRMFMFYPQSRLLSTPKADGGTVKLSFSFIEYKLRRTGEAKIQW